MCRRQFLTLLQAALVSVQRLRRSLHPFEQLAEPIANLLHFQMIAQRVLFGQNQVQIRSRLLEMPPALGRVLRVATRQNLAEPLV